MCGKHGHYLSFLWFLFYFGMAILDNIAAIKTTEYPTSTTVFVGDTVTYVCVVEEPLTDNNILHWYVEWNEDTIAIRRISAQENATISSLNRPEFSDRGMYTTSWYSTTSNSVRTHTCKLVISGVTLRDNGYFGVTYQMNADAVRRTLLGDKAPLTIYAKPAEEPECTKIDRETRWELMCEARGGNPPTDVTWYEGTVKMSESNPNSQTTTVVKGLNRRVFTCETQQGTLPKKICNIILNPTQTTTKTATTTFATKTRTTNKQETSTELVSPIRSSTPSQSGVTTTTMINTPRAVTLEAAVNSASGTTVAAIVGGVLGAVILILVFLLLLLRFRKSHENTQDTLGVSGPNINAPYVYESQIKPDQECANRSGDEEGYLELNMARISAPSHVYQTCQTTIPINVGTYNQADSSLYDIIK